MTFHLDKSARLAFCFSCVVFVAMTTVNLIALRNGFRAHTADFDDPVIMMNILGLPVVGFFGDLLARPFDDESQRMNTIKYMFGGTVGMSVVAFFIVFFASTCIGKRDRGIA
jgi:hypothetical protein